MNDIVKCFELDYPCPFPTKNRDPEHCLICTQVMINIYHVKNYALTTIKAVKEALETPIRPGGTTLSNKELFSDVI